MTNTLFGKLDDIAIDRLRYFEPPEGYHLAFSGGKDSVVLLDLAKRSGVKFEAHYYLVPIDPPELIRFVIKECPDVTVIKPRRGFFEQMRIEGIAPIRSRRWCCEEFKEWHGKGRFTMTGIRAEESTARKRRSPEELPTRENGMRKFLHPIFYWTTDDVWRYIRSRHLPYCPLYDEGFKRLGCVGCPNSTSHRWETRWPNIYENWRRNFVWIWEHKENLRRQWSGPNVMFKAWLDRKNSLHGDLRECELFPGGGTE